MKKYLLPLLVLLPSVTLFTSCSDDDNDDPTPTPIDQIVDSSILAGEWLAAESTASSWTTYEFTKSSTFDITLCINGETENGSGYYSFEEDNGFFGTYTTTTGKTKYLDWKFTKAQTFQIDYSLYSNNIYVSANSLYKILKDVEVSTGVATTPDYKGACGSSSTSNYSSLDTSIITVSSTGEIVPIAPGTTFLTFSTPNGMAALRVKVSATEKTFAEKVLGTWVLDVPSKNVWETYYFADGGYFSTEFLLNYEGESSTQTGTGTYSIGSNDYVNVSVKTSLGFQMNQEWRTSEMTDFTWTYTLYSDNANLGTYTAQKQLGSVTMDVNQTVTPDYASMVPAGYTISGYSSHNTKVATVNASTGAITAVGAGRTYIDVKTGDQCGVVEVVIENPIPVAFQDCIGQPVSKVYSVIGSNPTSTSGNYIIYKNYSTTIDQVGVQLDSWTNLVRGIVVTYNSKVDKDAVTSVLGNTFTAYASGTTSTLKAYMDTDDRSTANVGVTWDLSSLTLTYVNLFEDYFKDYTVLLGLTRAEAIAKVGSDPLLNNDQSMSWFLNEDLVGMTSAYYTDFTKYYTTACYVASILMSSADNDKTITYLKRKYTYYAQYSDDDELTFVSKDESYFVYYQPADKIVMYMIRDFSGYEQVTAQSMGKMISKARLLAKKALANQNAR